jgi:hypothetical protein
MEASEYFEPDYVIDDFVVICEILGVEFYTHPVKLYGGGVRREPNIYWSGFSSRGDGASFSGVYSYSKGSVKKIKDDYPTETDLHEIAETLYRIQAKNLFQLRACIYQQGYYIHEMTMSLSDFYRNDAKVWTDDSEDIVLECMRDLARWLYSSLEKEYDYITSPQNFIDQGLEYNEDGEMID